MLIYVTRILQKVRVSCRILPRYSGTAPILSDTAAARHQFPAGHLVPSTLWSRGAATARRSPTLHNSQLQSSPLPHVLLQISIQSTLIGRLLVAGRRHPCLPCRRSAMFIRSSSVRSDAGSGGSVDAVHVLATARVIPEGDNEKKPLWSWGVDVENAMDYTRQEAARNEAAYACCCAATGHHVELFNISAG